MRWCWSLPRTRSATRAAVASIKLLDLYVRDGEVYYRALKSDRAKLDGYVSSARDGVDRQAVARRADRVLAERLQRARAADGHRPLSDPGTLGASIRPRASARFRARSSGCRIAWPAARVTLDQIEQTILPSFTIRGSTSRSAAARSAAAGCAARRSSRARLEEQLAEVAAECVDPGAVRPRSTATTGKVGVSSIFSWREKEFVAAYADKAPAAFADRSPIERAVVAFVEPKLLTTEKEFLAKNTFQVAYMPFDWTLNDLTGRGGR